MAIQPMALGVTNPQINTVQALGQGMQAGQEIQANKMELAKRGLNMVGSIALGAMGGDLNGQVDPEKFNEGLDILASKGVDVEQFRNRPDIAPLVARSSLTTLQQLQNARDEQEFEMAMKRFDVEMAKALQPQTPKGSFTSPFQAVDSEGNTVWAQTDANGNVKVIDGLAPNNPIKTINTKTKQIVIDSRTGQTLSETPIENREAAQETAIGTGLGKSQAEAMNSAASLGSKLEGLYKVVEQLSELADTATYTVGGQVIDEGRKQLGLDPSEGAIARAKYIAIVDNQVLPLLRDTFGAAFTQKEGESLRATLGDPNKSPEEKKAVLEAFISQKVRDFEALQQQSGTISSPETDDPLGLF